MRIMRFNSFLIQYHKDTIDCDKDIYSCRSINKALETLLKNKNLKKEGLELL